MKCPTCTSPAPHLHPAMQHEGEVQPCRDDFHRRVTNQNSAERIAELDAEHARIHADEELMAIRSAPLECEAAELVKDGKLHPHWQAMARKGKSRGG